MSENKNEWSNLISHPQHELRFGGVHIVVDDGVFSPNPEITQSAQIILENLPTLKGMRIADVGTGSGVLAIAAAVAGAQEVIATDISDLAVQNAARNVTSNKVSDRVKIVKTDLLNGVQGTFDFIFANLPILDTVWNDEGIEIGSTTKKFFEDVKTKLSKDGKIYMPWGSFAEEERAALEDLLSESGYTFTLQSKHLLEHTWYLYIISKIPE